MANLQAVELSVLPRLVEELPCSVQRHNLDCARLSMLVSARFDTASACARSVAGLGVSLGVPGILLA